jgi:hypothetical protein
MLKKEKLPKGKTENTVKPRKREEEMSVTVKVSQPGYVPKGMKVRSRIDEYFFTANTSRDDLNEAGNDPLVESISPARPTRMIR